MGTAEFAANMARARESRGWSLNEVSRQLKERGLTGFHPATVARVEKGERQIRLDEAPVIAGLFEATVDQMMLPPDRFEGFLTYSRLASEYIAKSVALQKAAKAYEEMRREVLAYVEDQQQWLGVVQQAQVGALRVLEHLDAPFVVMGVVEQLARKQAGGTDGEHREAP